jgi:hypothetical protein
MTSSAPTRPLSDADVGELIKLARDADSVELKVTVPEPDQRAAVDALGIDPLDGQMRQVYFFDTPDLDCFKHGVVVRARRVQRRHDDSVVKLRPVVPSELPKEIRKSRASMVEVDAVPGGFVCSASMKGVVRKDGVKMAVAGDMPLRKLFAKEQRRFYAAHAPEGIGLDDLSILGPVFVVKSKWAPADMGRKVVAEVWLYPDNKRVVELSTKCSPHETFQVAAEMRAYLSQHGVDLSGEQEPKTGKALEFFSAELRDQAPTV